VDQTAGVPARATFGVTKARAKLERSPRGHTGINYRPAGHTLQKENHKLRRLTSYRREAGSAPQWINVGMISPDTSPASANQLRYSAAL
jgi:hypothetical protein